MMKKSCLKKVGGYDENYWTGQDHELWQRMKQNDFQFRYLSQPLLDYRLNPDSVRANSDENYWFKVSNACIWNQSKLRSLRYIDQLTWQQRIVIFFKMMIPHIIMRYRGHKV